MVGGGLGTQGLDGESGEADQLTLVLMAGLPGTGKSTLSLAVGRALGWPVVDKDIFDAVLRASGIAENPTAIAYDLMLALAKDLLAEQRLSVILDCPGGYPARVEQAAALAREAGARFNVVLCLAERDERNRRMAREVPQAAREWRPPPRRRSSDIVGDGRDEFPHLPAAALLIETTRPMDEVVAEVVAQLRGTRT